MARTGTFEAGLSAVVLGIVLIFLASASIHFAFAILSELGAQGRSLSTSDLYVWLGFWLFMALCFGAYGCICIRDYVRSRHARERRVALFLERRLC